MPAYHQMGNDSRNLLFLPELNSYAGAILSPVNDAPNDVTEIIQQARAELDEFDVVFDPQLYYPKSNRGQLSQWGYFPNNFDTVDQTNMDWWRRLNNTLAQVVLPLRPNKICSPVHAPRTFNLEYFAHSVALGEHLGEVLSGTDVQPMLTILVSMLDLADFRNVLQIASVVTQTTLKEVYLVFYTDVRPRLELTDPEVLKGAKLLISNLETNGLRVLVGSSSSEFVLWKHSGATSVATGKFFNLRRFTPSRWDEPAEGGGQLPYLFEEGLLGFFRELDIPRLEAANLISAITQANPFYTELRSRVAANEPWLGFSWRFYMYWFADLEHRLATGQVDSLTLVRQADENWGVVQERAIILDERLNDGRWIRQWLRALTEPPVVP